MSVALAPAVCCIDTGFHNSLLLRTLRKFKTVLAAKDEAEVRAMASISIANCMFDNVDKVSSNLVYTIINIAI
jgi:hypothetical protein